ncbi:MAG: hypothetical protein OYK82_00330 [Gammaproteobacteria bacterium]|nr:hypothetical protein [Gammaproteobacteria bacterium]
MSGPRRLPAFLVAFLIASCGDATEPTAPPRPGPATGPANRAPTAGEIPAQRLSGPGDTVTVDAATYFGPGRRRDLTFAASISDTTVARVAVEGSRVTVTAGSAGGSATLTVTARNPAGLSASAAFAVVVNRVPAAAGMLPTVTLTEAGAAVAVELSAYFRDPDGDALAYTAASSDAVIVRVAVEGAALNLTARGIGEASVTVTATDPDGLSASQGFAVTVTEHPDRAALIALYEATDGPNWRNSDYWLTDAPLGRWYGVSARADDRVSELNLSANNLSGEIPPEIGNLTNLGWLSLSNNDLSGPIPPEIGNLARLENLYLPSNLSGPIPSEIGNLARLENLYLGGNLSGPIPPEIGNLARLENLDLGGNLSGPIPPEIGNLTRLKSLGLGGNLSGPIPPEIGNLTSLETLNITYTALSGEIPPELGNLTSLETLYLNTNALSGPIPPEIGNLARLETLYLQRNALIGEIPPELGNLARLEFLRLAGNADLCAPDDPGLRTWLLDKSFSPFPCQRDDIRILPRALIRSDGDGLSLNLPDDLHVPAAVNVSAPGVVAATVVSGAIRLVPRSPGRAEVEIVPSGGELPAVAGVVVREPVGTFGIDIAMKQPAPMGYEEGMIAAADWWSSVLDGTEWPDQRLQCGNVPVIAEADELVIWAGTNSHPGALGWAGPCFSREPDGLPSLRPTGGVVWMQPDYATSQHVLRHEIGHLLGLVSWPTWTGLTLTIKDRKYFVGPRAVEVYRAGGGDPDLPGVPFGGSGYGPHWVGCDLMGLGFGCSQPVPNVLSLAALADAGYTVDMSKATPWPQAVPAAMPPAGGESGDGFRDYVIVEIVEPDGLDGSGRSPGSRPIGRGPE